MPRANKCDRDRSAIFQWTRAATEKADRLRTQTSVFANREEKHILKLINNSLSGDKGKHNREGGLDTRS